MTTATSRFELYDILVEKGVEKSRAKAAIDEFITRDEARNSLATKSDISELKDQMRSQIMWTASLLVGQIAVNTAIMFALFQLYAG